VPPVSSGQAAVMVVVPSFAASLALCDWLRSLGESAKKGGKKRKTKRPRSGLTFNRAGSDALSGY